MESFLKTRMALKFKEPGEGSAYCINKRYVSDDMGIKLYPALKQRFKTHHLYHVDGWDILEIQ
ncbi:MAG: hypothetical protein ACRCXX_06560 [Cetobacterium sp.]|uniref:hypothetical protein n=1 Tax=Cetobacterium sp. TaxID=2071632 RepID=UPI003F30ACE9